MRTAPRAIEKAVQFQPETVSSFSQNRCPVWPEYAIRETRISTFLKKKRGDLSAMMSLVIKEMK